MNNFTPRAQQVLAHARREADRMNQNYVDSEHLLLGLIKLRRGTAVAVLQKMVLDLETVCVEVEKLVGNGPKAKVTGSIPYTPCVKKVLALAGKEARALNHNYIGTEHLLLGLLREKECVAARALTDLGVDFARTQLEIVKELDPNFTHDAESPSPQGPIKRISAAPGRFSEDRRAKGPAQEPKKQSWLRELLKRIARSILDSLAPRLNNFTPRAQQVVVLAREEASRFKHNYVGTEHLLLGLIKLGHGVAVNVLQKMGLNLETVRMEVEKWVGSGPETKMAGSIPYTPRVKKVLALAGKEAKSLDHTYVGTEHILLGLLRESEGVAGRVLKHLGVDIALTRNEIRKELDPNATPDA